jgi:hypothetical protein
VSDTIAIGIITLGILLLTHLVHQLELALAARGWGRLAHALAFLRAAVPFDAPTMARRIQAMRTGRAPLPTLPEIPHPPREQMPDYASDASRPKEL